MIKYNITTLEDLKKKMCLNKTKYLNINNIKSFLKKLKKQGKFNYEQVNIYSCPFCKKLHWGSAKLSKDTITTGGKKIK